MTKNLPSGLKATPVIKDCCGKIVCNNCPSRLQILKVLSSLPEAIISPSGLKLILRFFEFISCY
jgi:hypothetical protein